MSLARRSRAGAVALVIATGLGCGSGNESAPVAVADAGPRPDARPAGDAAPPPPTAEPLLWVQFSATGCREGGSGQRPCRGAAPLAVEFTAVAPAAIDTYVWRFGDGSPVSDEAHPRHVYDVPGTYDASLTVGGPGGTASSLRVGFLEVTPASTGGACRRDEQCGDGLSCACGEAQPCDIGIEGGVCTRTCGTDAPCPDGSACVDLGVVGSAAEPWRGRRCLSRCDDGCRAGFSCRALPAGDGAAAWTEACFATDVLADIGTSCAAADGTADPAACSGGQCAPPGTFGVRGQCTAPCDTSADCPADAACATFGSGASRCVARCADARPCDRDPWLSCAAPGADGARGFTVDEEPADAGYCAPRPCTDDDACPAGACLDGHCALAGSSTLQRRRFLGH